MSDLSVTDALALAKDTDGFGNNGSWWIIILFLFMFNGGFWGRNDNREVATTGDIQRGFDTNTITNKLDAIGNGLCDGFYAQNTTMLNGINGINQTINSMGNNINSLGYEFQNCCCSTNRNIDSIRYENAKNTADIIAATNYSTRDILESNCSNTQKILDKLNNYEMQSLRDKLTAYETQLSNMAQTQNIINQVRPFPQPAYLTSSPYQSVASCGCTL